MVNDGPFRDIENPENKQILDELEAGYVPAALMPPNATPNQPVNCGLVDRRQEKYVPPPPPAYIAFSGTGNTTGASLDAEAYIFTPVELADVPAPVLADSRPSTLIQVKQASGPKKLRLKVNSDISVLAVAKLAR